MQLDEFLEAALSSEHNDFLRFKIGKVEAELAEKIFAATGLDVFEFEISMDSYAVRHIFERHGNAGLEAKRGQIGIEKDDFKRLPEILTAPDAVILSMNSKGPLLETLVFEKEIDGFFYVLKEVRRVVKKGKINRLALLTMYKTQTRRVF